MSNDKLRPVWNLRLVLSLFNNRCCKNQGGLAVIVLLLAKKDFLPSFYFTALSHRANVKENKGQRSQNKLKLNKTNVEPANCHHKVDVVDRIIRVSGHLELRAEVTIEYEWAHVVDLDAKQVVRR
ncbi:hypothetical protein F2P81_023203 [Scophthalmus maximus]|uniref:Uncharacterized protein n=1 Tax=Scophthalmus maximus TaxID=52904 RepID=A0A6A4RZJ3_SCOMX|nr:hypothetical protein F2P81_023203 [Scophthalmus maximus]